MTEPCWPDWQTIDRAPKDGRDVLLCREGEQGVYIGRWWDYRGAGHWHTYDTSPPHWEPDHWCPLPDAKGAPPVGSVK